MVSAARGDMDAFGDLVLRHQARAWRTAYHYVGNHADAEDLAQEAFLRILGAASAYRPTARFTTYLYRVIANLCLDFRRKKRALPADDVPSPQSQAAPPGERMSVHERDQLIRAALAKLPDRQRLAVVLRYYEDLSLGEIADSMDTTHKAVERLLARARSSLGCHLRDFMEE